MRSSAIRSAMTFVGSPSFGGARENRSQRLGNTMHATLHLRIAPVLDLRSYADDPPPLMT